MNRWGCFGLAAGGLAGLLIVSLILIFNQPRPFTVGALAPAVAPDVTVFLSEQTLSRLASEELQNPTVVDFEPDGLMIVSARAPWRGWEPLVHVGLRLELQGPEVVSELEWLRLGWLNLPAAWLPAEARQATAIIGQELRRQIPPDFTLVGLGTTSDGVQVQLRWVGR